jgi:hypothetical protein
VKGSENDLIEQAACKRVTGMDFRIFGEITFQGNGDAIFK